MSKRLNISLMILGVIMKNIYLHSYFPLLSIVLFSLAISFRVEMLLIQFLQRTGLYDGMGEFFSETGIKIALLLLLFAIFFMLFAALKLIADTLNELSLLFFSKDSRGEALTQVKGGSFIFFLGGIFSLFSLHSVWGIGILFFLTTITYFIYFVYKVSSHLSIVGLIGLVFFQVMTWATLIVGFGYIVMKVYNSIIASLPI